MPVRALPRSGPRPRSRAASALLAAPVLAVVLTVAGCGGDGGSDGGSGSPSGGSSSGSSGSTASAADAPTDASATDFCNALSAADSVSEADGTDEQTEAAHAAGAQLITTGTPSDMPAEARDGFEIYADAIVDVTPAQVEKIANGNDAAAFKALGIDSDGQTAVRAMVAYAGTTCATTSSPSDSPS